MTALNYNIPHPPLNSVAKSIGRASKFRLLNRKRLSSQPLRKPPQPRSDDVSCGTSKPRKSILSSIRHSYASRGLPASNTGLVHSSPDSKDDAKQSERTSSVVSPDCKSDCVDLASDSEPIVSIDGARRSVSLLKIPVCDDGMDDDQTDDETVSCSSDDSDAVEIPSQKGDTAQTTTRQYRIQFKCYVKVAEIPHRDSYSPTQRMQMWNDCKTIRERAKVNRIEYDWEGTDWENAPEEDEFCNIDGNIVHPAHLF